MSPLDTIRSLGRPLAYYPAIAKHVGGINAAIFLGQLMYWDERTADVLLGVYKSSEQWEHETGLSYKEQMNARRKLRNLGLLVETHKRLQHRIYYKLDRAAFDAFMTTVLVEKRSENGEMTDEDLPDNPNSISPNDQRAFRGQPKGVSGADPKGNPCISTETTTEITAETTGQAPLELCPVEQIVDLYHRFMPDNPTVKILDTERRKNIQERWLEASTLSLAPFHCYQTANEGLAAWQEFFDICAHSDFLTGKVVPAPGRRVPFIADLDFLISPKGFKGCIENKYHRGDTCLNT